MWVLCNKIKAVNCKKSWNLIFFCRLFKVFLTLNLLIFHYFAGKSRHFQPSFNIVGVERVASGQSEWVRETNVWSIMNHIVNHFFTLLSFFMFVCRSIEKLFFQFFAWEIFRCNCHLCACDQHNFCDWNNYREERE